MGIINVAVFPVDIDYLSSIGNRKLNMGKDILNVNQLLTLKGWNVCSGRNDNITVSELDDKLNLNADAILLVDSLHILEYESMENMVKIAQKQNLQIINTRNTLLEEGGLIKELCIKFNVKYYLVQENHIPEDRKIKEFEDISVPIVSVVGIGPNTQISNIEVQLLESFQRDACKVTYISSNRAGCLLGAHTIPDFMYNNKYTEKEKIYLFHQYIYQIVNYEKPDIILLGVPGEIMPLSKKHSYNFGLLAYMIFSAITPDISILSLYNLAYTDDFISNENSFCKYHLNMEPDIFYCSNIGILETSLRESVIQYFVTEDVYDDLLNDYKVYSSKELASGIVYERILNKLEEYGNMNFI